MGLKMGGFQQDIHIITVPPDSGVTEVTHNLKSTFVVAKVWERKGGSWVQLPKTQHEIKDENTLWFLLNAGEFRIAIVG